MPDPTTNYSLTKPAIASTGWGQAANANLDAIDAQMKANEDLAHTRLHDIDGTSDHNGVSGATEDNFLSFDANGLPQDSGYNDTTYADVDHNADHERGGSDVMDGDHLDITFTPSHYTPATTPAEAAHVDDLASHLSGLDTAIGSVVSNIDYRTIIIDGGGAAIGAGRKPCFTLPAGTITGIWVYADQSTTTVVDIWKCTYADYDNSAHPVDGDSITSATPITITAAHKATDVTLTSWTTAITALDNFTPNVDSNDNATWIAITFRITLT